MLHPDADLKDGGYIMKDEDGVIPNAVKNILAKLAKSLTKGQLADISKIAAPSYVHHNYSHCGMAANDVVQC